jgi:hypothetical protein
VAVLWITGYNSGTVDSSMTVTDASGIASANWTLGTIAQVDTLTATIPDGTSIAITAIAVAGPINGLAKAGGDAQSVASGGSTSQPLVVRAVDRFGNPAAGVTVSWVSNAGTLSSRSTTTGPSGQAFVTLTTAAAPMTYSITATAGAGATTIFTLTGT